jgi:glc operon protein GlcG
MREHRFFCKFAVALLWAGTSVVFAQQPNATGMLPNPYGPPITLKMAKSVVAPAIAKATKNNWNMAVAIVDASGNLVYFEKMDNTELASPTIAIDKARSAASFKRPTKSLQVQLAAGGEGLRYLSLQGAIPVDGGIPLIADGKIIGAIGVSGGTSSEDGQSAQAGADSLK